MLYGTFKFISDVARDLRNNYHDSNLVNYYLFGMKTRYSSSIASPGLSPLGHN